MFVLLFFGLFVDFNHIHFSYYNRSNSVSKWWCLKCLSWNLDITSFSETRFDVQFYFQKEPLAFNTIRINTRSSSRRQITK